MQAAFKVEHIVADDLVALVYYPFIRLSQLVEHIGYKMASVPLYDYRNHIFCTIRNDSSDRFGKRLEHRLARSEIAVILDAAGLIEVRFSENASYWCNAGAKR